MEKIPVDPLVRRYRCQRRRGRGSISGATETTLAKPVFCRPRPCCGQVPKCESQFDIIVADNNATPILFKAENGCQFFPWESVFAVGEIKASYRRVKNPIRMFAQNVAKLKTQLVRLPTPPSYLGNGVSLGKAFKSSDERKVRNPLLSFMVFFDSGAATRASLADEYSGASDEYLPIVTSFLDGKAIVKAELERAQNGVKMGMMDLNPQRTLDRKDVHWMLIDYVSQSDGGAQALVVLMLGLFDHLNNCRLMPPPIHEYLNAITRTAANQPLPLSLSALVNASELSGTPLPKALVRFFEERAARGKSPFTKVTKGEVARLARESGMAIEELIEAWPEASKPSQEAASGNHEG